MKKRLLKLTLLLVCLPMAAQNVELSKALLEEFQIKQSSVTDKSINTVTSQDYLWMTPFLHKVMSHWKDLTQEAQDVFEVYTQTPVFSGDELTYEEGKFKFHYTINSGEAGEDVDSTDTNSNNVPDYIESMAADFGVVASKYHTEMGLSEVIYEDDNYYHIYVNGDEAGEDVYGYVSPDPQGIVGDNPSSTDITEIDAARSFMVMRNHYKDFPEPEKALKVTAAHEYMHAIQFSYDWEVATWFAEACATWGEEFVFPGYDDNFQYLSYIFSTPDISLNVDDSEGEDFEGHWYGTFLFTQYMVEHTGAAIIDQIYRALIGDLWEKTTSEVIDEVLKANWQDSFSGFEDLFGSYALANTILSSDEGFAPFVYARADSYYAEVENLFYDEFYFEFNGTAIAFDSEIDGNGRLMRLSYDPFSLSSTENFKLSLTAEGDVDMFLVKVGDTDQKIVMTDENGEIKVSDNALWKGYYIAVIRWDTEVTNSASVDYFISVTQLNTGLNDVAQSSVTLVPNPANAYVDLKGVENVEDIRILDVAGRQVAYHDGRLSQRIDLSALSPGTYFVKATVAGKETIVEQLIVTNK